MRENIKKRADFKQSVMTALQQILNDPAIMPNADCPDIVVIMKNVVFGKTVREIYIDYQAHWRCSPEQAKLRIKGYFDRAKQQNQNTYVDFTDVFTYREYTELVETALQSRLKLQYRPVIMLWQDIGN